ncbi:MAG: hypothetical protein H6890_08780 [Brucellaceae bacterium]|nr:hypothetical protein [Brucellaceae bacterium]
MLLGFSPLALWAIWKGEPLDKFGGETVEYLFNAVCIGLVVLGQVIRALTIGHVPQRTSGRNTKLQIADTLNTTGLYSLTRNPLYLGNCISVVGILLYPQDAYLALTAILFLTLYYGAIIMAEESFLSGQFGEQYLEWASRTNAFFPAMRRWTPPALPFSWRFTLRREHSSWYAVFMPLYLISALQEYVAHGEFPSMTWNIALVIMTLIYAGSIIVKKNTGWLNDFR